MTDPDATPPEPAMPPPGTPERERMEREHAAMVKGLLEQFRASRSA